MKCQNCQAENPDTAAFCNKCGAKLEPTQGQTPPPAEKKKRGRTRTLIIVAGAVIVLCIVVAIIAALSSGGGEGATPTPERLADLQQPTEPAPTEPRPAPTSPATAEPPRETPPPAPTDTPQPTSTPLPTSTQGPTRTPRPTNTPKPPTDTPIPPTKAPTKPPTDTPIPPTKAPTKPPTPTFTPEPTKPPQALVVIADVYNQSYTEHVKITNKGDGPANMSGWFVHGSKGDEVYTFPNGYILQAGATVRLHSGKNGINAPPSDIYWTDKTVWNNQGETVFLKDAQGTLVHKYSY
jgi:hypothetical protein